MISQGELITQNQLNLLKELSEFESSIDFHSLTQIPLASNELQTKVSEQSHEHKQSDNNKLSKSMGFENVGLPLNKKRQSSVLIQFKQQIYQNDNNGSKFEGFVFIQKQLQKQGGYKYNEVKKRLIGYKQRSDKIYKVSQFIRSYEQNFSLLVFKKNELVSMLNDIKGQTSNLVQRQKRYIDLSMCIKQSLDYYSYHQKNIFNYACQISSKQLFEENLQSTLSTIMDAIQFFQSNHTFVQSKKHLNIYLSSKSKILSFIKSFYIKLFNKQNAFIMKHLNFNKIDLQLNSIYPKSRIKLLSDFLITFPHMKKQLKQILINVKDQNVDNTQKQIDLKFLEMRQLEIQEFQLNQSNISLIRYLEKNNFELYSQVMLNLFTFNRFNFHQNFIFNWARRINSQINNNQSQQNKQKQRLKHFKSKLHFVIQIIIAEYSYFILCCNPQSSQSIEFITSWMYKLIFKYLDILVKQSRQFVVKYKSNPFELCEQISVVVDKQVNSYLQNLQKEQYQSYVMGSLWYELITKNMRLKGQRMGQNFHGNFLRQLFKNSLKNKILTQIGQFCYQNLPKMQLTSSKQQVQQNINRLIYYIPKLKYCQKNAQNYMISSLDILIKSIKQINLLIQSRFECYSWNLIIFGVIRNILLTKQFHIISKQIRLDFNQSLNIIDKVKLLQRSQSLIQYAQDIFNVIKTGMPSLNQLTLDFNQYINQHYQSLQQRFLKDILFIYAKNMIEFLQKAMDAKKKIHQIQSIHTHKYIDDNHSQEIKQISSQNILQLTQNEQHKISKSNNSPKTEQKNKKSPKTQNQKQKHILNQLQKLCDHHVIKSLYTSYIMNIQKYIKQSRQMLKITQQTKIQKKQNQIKKLKNLIRQVYQKLFDFLDNFYVIVSQVNSQFTIQFEEIATIKQKQQSLWLGGSKQSTSTQQIKSTN